MNGKKQWLEIHTKFRNNTQFLDVIAKIDESNKHKNGNLQIFTQNFIHKTFRFSKKETPKEKQAKIAI